MQRKNPGKAEIMRTYESVVGVRRHPPGGMRRESERSAFALVVCGVLVDININQSINQSRGGAKIGRMIVAVRRSRCRGWFWPVWTTR